MSQAPRTYIQEVEKARKDLNKVNGQLQSQKHRDDLRQLVERYFSVIRPSFVSNREQGQAIKVIDDLMQELLILCHKRSMAKRYQEILTSVKKSLIELDSQNIATAGQTVGNNGMDLVDTQIVDTLQDIVPS